MRPPITAPAERRHARRRRASPARSSTRAPRKRQVFLNVPFDDIDAYEDCFLAYVGGLVGLGLKPRSVLEIPSGGRDRLTRIFRLMRECRYSVHDLSRVQLRAGRYPRFNMPFELGLGTALSLAPGPPHDRYVFATGHRLVQRVASDLGGVDVYEHRGTARGVILALTNAFVRRRRSVGFPDLVALHRRLRQWREINCRRHRPRRSLYEPAIFSDLVFFASALGHEGPLRAVPRRTPARAAVTFASSRH
jgi:hypothetical protein